MDLRDRNRTFESLVTYNIIGPVGVDTGGNPSTAWPYLASGNYFDALGIQPYLGRFFHAADEHGTEQRSLCGAELRLLAQPFSRRSRAWWGGRCEINKHPLTIIGVAPPEFRGTELFFAPALWIPMVEQPTIEGYDNLK